MQLNNYSEYLQQISVGLFVAHFHYCLIAVDYFYTAITEAREEY